jgi:hypothetical protein
MLPLKTKLKYSEETCCLRCRKFADLGITQQKLSASNNATTAICVENCHIKALPVSNANLRSYFIASNYLNDSLLTTYAKVLYAAFRI